MEPLFDPDKDVANRAKHGISLARAFDMRVLALKPDNRLDYGEPRFRAWGTIDGRSYCLAFALRDGRARPISLRPSRAKEMRRHVPRT